MHVSYICTYPICLCPEKSVLGRGTSPGCPKILGRPWGWCGVGNGCKAVEDEVR